MLGELRWLSVAAILSLQTEEDMGERGCFWSRLPYATEDLCNDTHLPCVYQRHSLVAADGNSICPSNLGSPYSRGHRPLVRGI